MHAPLSMAVLRDLRDLLLEGSQCCARLAAEGCRCRSRSSAFLGRIAADGRITKFECGPAHRTPSGGCAGAADTFSEREARGDGSRPAKLDTAGPRWEIRRILKARQTSTVRRSRCGHMPSKTVEFSYLQVITNHLSGDRVTVGSAHWDGSALRFACAVASLRDHSGFAEVQRAVRAIKRSVDPAQRGASVRVEWSSL